uniref:Uncharacterized protein n=1 Tax=Kalanchoe fedtschenkoi TaxID=63787 RepID=A0A7N0VEA4_KALFE
MNLNPLKYFCGCRFLVLLFPSGCLPFPSHIFYLFVFKHLVELRSFCRQSRVSGFIYCRVDVSLFQTCFVQCHPINVAVCVCGQFVPVRCRLFPLFLFIVFSCGFCCFILLNLWSLMWVGSVIGFL